YTTDGTTPDGSRGNAVNGSVIRFERVEGVWDTLVWDYLTRWQAVIPGQPDETRICYKIGAWSIDRNNAETFADWPITKEIVEHSAMVFFNGVPPIPNYQPGDPTKGRVFSYYVDTITPPEWARETII